MMTEACIGMQVLGGPQLGFNALCCLELPISKQISQAAHGIKVNARHPWMPLDEVSHITGSELRLAVHRRCAQSCGAPRN